MGDNLRALFTLTYGLTRLLQLLVCLFEGVSKAGQVLQKKGSILVG